MARSLANSCLSIQHILPAAAAYFLTFVAILTVFSSVIFLCGGHEGMMKSVMGREKGKTVRLGGEQKKKKKEWMVEKMKSSKALLMNKMIYWRNEEEEGDHDQDGVVWKKAIIKGEKCRPIDFSGKILYDADGNLLPD